MSRSFDVPTNPALEVEVLILEGPSAGRQHLVRKLPATLGRGHDVDLQLEDDPQDPTLSRRHARISLEGKQIYLCDLSTNGTWLGGQRIQAGEAVPVSPEEDVWLGPRTRLRLRLRQAGPPQAQAPGEAPARAGATILEIQALGTFSLAIAGQPVPEAAWEARKAIILATCLADSSPRALSPERLEQLLWPDAPEGARQALQRAMSRVRKAFRSVPGSPDPVELNRHGYQLSAAYTLILDVRRFETACEAAGQARSQGLADRERAALEEAVSLYHGELLPGHHEEWVERRRRALETRAFQASEQLAAYCLAEAEWDRAIHLYEAVLHRDPCREISQVGWVSTLLQAGRREEALRAYQECVRSLKRLMGLTPGVELVRLYETARGAG